MTLATLPALLILDGLLGLAYRTDTTAHVSVIVARSGKTHRAIVVFPGYVMPAATVGRAFAPYVGVEDALVLVDYAERGVNPAQIYDEVMTALRGLRPTELRIYGASMGGMLSKLFLDRYRQAGTPYGKVVLILDSAPAKASNVKRPTLLLHVSCWYHGGPLSSIAWALANQFGNKPPIEASGRSDLVRSARTAGLWVGMPAATSQACFIARFDPLIKGELLDVAQQVVFLHGFSPNDDPVVRISEAVAAWRVAFPKLVVVTVQGRAGRWHLPLVEYPRETVNALNAEYQ